ncbi:MAG: ParB/RepB/Spo0J family partition protein [Saprospiraceae bacterium]|nr:ParB/RepB/Spo0J family partition protein [Saprospiraceae bacterium]MDW8484158.1 ParB/RepB/Spo0J family partition protein [Saprospiraceae bacterium]
MSKKLSKADFGKGIRALLANPIELERAVQENPAAVVRELTHTVAMLPLEQIKANPFQPRTEFDHQALQELADSIRIHGLIQPITVRRLHEHAYQLISGERRLRACQMAGLTEIPAYIRIANDQQMLEMALIENIHRQDLNAIEIAISYQRLKEECNLTDEQLSERVGKQRSTITNYLRLLKLPADIQQAIKNGSITMGHARALAGITDIAFQLSLFRQILEEDLSVRAVEQIIAKHQTERPGNKARTQKFMPDALRDIRDRFSAFFGTKVDLRRNDKGKGQLIIKFNSDAELNRLLDIITEDQH